MEGRRVQYLEGGRYYFKEGSLGTFFLAESGGVGTSTLEI